MVTGFEVKMYADIESIARSLDRIAGYLEDAELRARSLEAAELRARCLEAAELRARRMEEEAETTSPTKHS